MNSLSVAIKLANPLKSTLLRPKISFNTVGSIKTQFGKNNVNKTQGLSYSLNRLSLRSQTPDFTKRSFHTTRATQAIVQFKLADIGEGIAECEVLKWHVKEGQEIHQFDLLCEVQSDKATVEITSRYDGIIKKLHYNKGDMAKVGSPLVDIEASPEQANEAGATSHGHGSSSASTESSQSSQSTSSTSSITQENEKALASPAVRHLAARHQIPLKQVAGTGRDGRILKEDILKFISGEVPQTANTPVTPQTPTPSQPSKPTPAPVAAPIIIGTEDRVVPMSGYSRVMAKTMTISNTIPHFGYNDEVYVDNLIKFRKELKSIAESRGIKLTLMPIIIKATSLALKQYPLLNSSYDEPKNSIIYKGSHNIGIAVDTPNGLIVPNIKNVQNKSIFEIAQDMNRIHQAALKAAVAKEDLVGGTFSLSNIGTIGGTYASPVIVSPEVAIGAIGKIQRVPRFDSADNVIPVQLFNISWSADHRVIDGATMANFSNLWKKYLENPQMMLLDTK